MSKPASKIGDGTIVPVVHLEFIQNQAGASEETGLQEIESYHRALFLHHHARDLERFRQQAELHEERLSHLESRLKQTREKLSGVDRVLPVDFEGQPDVKPASPWNLWDRCMFTVAGLAVLVLVVFGVLNISFNLLESGLVTFVENPVRAYFWAALLPVGALAVKVGWDFIQERRRREIYLWTCLALGIAGVLVWLAAYATVYPTLSKSAREHIESLSVFETGASRGQGLLATTSGGVKWIDVITVVAQATAEVFLSAVLGMYMTAIYLRHRPVRLAGNPLFTEFDEERRVLEQSIERERMAFAESKGSQSQLENQLSALLSFARSMFHQETVRQRDQSRQTRLRLDQITEHLRTQLRSVEPDGSAERNAEAGTALTSRQNGI